MTRRKRSPRASRPVRTGLVGLVALVLVGATGGTATAAPSGPPAPAPGPLGYRSTALVSVTGQLFYPSTSGNPISPTDRIAGHVDTQVGNDTAQQAAVFYVDNRTVRLLHPPGSAWASAVDINRRGQVTGTAHFYGAGEQTYVWTSSTNTYRLLGSLGGYWSRPAAINDAGVVVGQSTTETEHGGVLEFADHAFVYDPARDGGRLRDLGTLPGGRDSGALGVNNDGDVVGYVGAYPGDVGQAFLWRPTTGVMTDLGHPGGDNATWATDISDQGVVVGGSGYRAPFGGSAVDRPSRAFVLSPVTSRFRLLPSRSGYAAVASAVNYHGLVVGTSGIGTDSAQALLWNACGTAVQVLADGPYGTAASGINRHEHVVGQVGYASGGGSFWRRNDGACLPQALVAR